MRQRSSWRTNATTIGETANQLRCHAKRNPESMATPRARVAVASCRRALGIGDYEGDSDRRVVGMTTCSLQNAVRLALDRWVRICLRSRTTRTKHVDAPLHRQSQSSGATLRRCETASRARRTAVPCAICEPDLRPAFTRGAVCTPGRVSCHRSSSGQPVAAPRAARRTLSLDCCGRAYERRRRKIWQCPVRPQCCECVPPPLRLYQMSKTTIDPSARVA